MIDQQLLTRSVSQATAEVFSTMLGMEIALQTKAVASQDSESGVLSFIGITGDWGGAGVFCCTPALASVLCSQMLGNCSVDGKAVIDEEVLDVVAEITNMVIGNIKNALEKITGALAISVPTVVYGRNFRFRNMGGQSAATLSFTAANETFEVRLALAPVARTSAANLRMPMLGLTSR